MKRFSFAGLLGASPRATAATAAEDEDVTAMDEDDEAPAAEDEDAPAAEGDAPAEDGEDEDETPAARRAFRRGRMAERARIGAILDAADTGNVALAAQLACATDLAPAQARAVLSAAPVAAAGSARLAAAMRGRDPAPLATGASADKGGSGPEAEAARILANAGRSKKER